MVRQRNDCSLQSVGRLCGTFFKKGDESTGAKASVRLIRAADGRQKKDIPLRSMVSFNRYGAVGLCAVLLL